MKLIPLPQGKFAMVDDEDYDKVMEHKWSTSIRQDDRSIRAWVGDKKITLMSFLFSSDRMNKCRHVNGNTLDFSRKNIVEIAHNAVNQGISRKNTSSKFVGISFNKQKSKWEAYINLRGNRTRLGVFLSEIEAAKAYNAKALELFGENAKLNVFSTIEGNTPL